MKLSKKLSRCNNKIRKTKTQKGGAFINMGSDWKKHVMPTLPKVITCPICNEKHEKNNLIYDVNSFRSGFRKKNPDGIRVRSIKLPSRRIFLKIEELTGTAFYFVCSECNFMFLFRNQTSENKKIKS